MVGLCFTCVKKFGRTMLYMCIEYHILVNMYHVSAQGIDERMINVHYYYYGAVLSLTAKTSVWYLLVNKHQRNNK